MWQSEGLSQTDFMIKDQCIVLDENDIVTGSASKYDTHVFSEETPRGQLHRAFSVFLFNDEGKLLLQQRAGSKITFPDVWTNSCCSHPLSGYTPEEVDTPSQLADASVPGVKAAAIRKLKHELGIEPEELPADSFKFLTRLHYWAADVVTHGKESMWGEHEIDYILFVRANVTCNINVDEVKDTKYVSLPELQEMMTPGNGLLWSPWFRIIAEKFLVHWWKDLDATLTTDRFVDVKTIHRFDPSVEHMGGAGNAGAWLGAAEYAEKKTLKPVDTNATNTNKNLKQGSYGKIMIHKHSKLTQLMHFDEIFAAVWFQYVETLPNQMDTSDDIDLGFCDDMLTKVSRSFASVIKQLPAELCKDILVFYLVLRALDTIEDDMTAFVGREHEKVDALNNFYRTALITPGWSMTGVGEGDERVLLEKFHHVVALFLSLTKSSQTVIANITMRMGQGMASFVEKDLGQGTVEMSDYNLYCHYVAGMIGEGLSKLFTYSGHENIRVEEAASTTANTMGLFLQKTNIIRDYLEDFVDGRTFWPQEVWRLYESQNKGGLGEFAQPAHRRNALHCLNHLVTDALQCIPECVEYMSLLQTEETFRFCAIPQVMAIATLSELYNNQLVFSGVVKIRKGMAAQLILDSKSMYGLHKWFFLFAHSILARVPDSDPNAKATRAICRKVILLTQTKAWTAIYGGYAATMNLFAPVVVALSAVYLFFSLGITLDALPTSMSALLVWFFNGMQWGYLSQHWTHVLATCFLVASVFFMLGYSIVSSARIGLKKSE